MTFLNDAGLVQLWQSIQARLSNKLDKIPGKVLSSNDFTDELKVKLDSLENAAQPDWAASEGEEGYILNKPIIPNLNDVAMKDDLTSLASTTYVDTKVAALVDSSPETLNTLNELAAALGDDPNFAATIATQIGELEENKVEKIAGKGLSTNDYTTADKTLLNTIADQYLTRDDIAYLDVTLYPNDTDANMNYIIPSPITKENMISMVWQGWTKNSWPGTYNYCFHDQWGLYVFDIIGYGYDSGNMLPYIYNDSTDKGIKVRFYYKV